MFLDHARPGLTRLPDPCRGRHASGGGSARWIGRLLDSGPSLLQKPDGSMLTSICDPFHKQG